MVGRLLRSLIAVIVGALVAFGLIWLAQRAGSSFSPDVYDPETGEVLISLGSTISLLAGWAIGGFAGAWLAIRLSGQNGPGWIVAGMIFGATLYRAVTLSDAWWIMALGLFIPLGAAWAAQYVTTATARAAT